MKKISKEKKLAQDHWAWVKGLITRANPAMEKDIQELCEYIYCTAFIHGWKHKHEDRRSK